MSKTLVVVPNWNGADSLKSCLDSLLAQSLKVQIVVVDNNSSDGSLELLKKYPDVELIKNAKNKGYAGGVNPGFRKAIDLGFDYVASFNNDAIADKDWLKYLSLRLDSNPSVGTVACKLLGTDGKHIDSTGEFYTIWGLPYPRGRGEADIDKYDQQIDIFAASGGASLYRVKMLEEVGLFDESFFAYYEDVDLSFRAQLAGWKIAFVPESKAYHQIGATSSRIRGFTTYQTLKNLPILLVKNVPKRYLWKVCWRYFFVMVLFFGRAVLRGHAWSAIKGKFMCVWLLPSTLSKRRLIQKGSKVDDEYIWRMLVHDLPPGATNLRKLRRFR